MPLIIISGNIGSGKSTLSSALAKAAGARHLPENADEFTFLPDFYRDKARWAFQCQLQFVVHKFDQQRRALERNDLVIQDGSAYESFWIFAHKHLADGLMEAREFENLRDVYHLLADIIPPPDLLVHLTAPIGVLLERICSRGRAYEQRIPAGYIQDLEDRYLQWTDSWSSCTVLRIDTSRLNFLTRQSHVLAAAEQIQTALSSAQGRANQLLRTFTADACA